MSQLLYIYKLQTSCRSIFSFHSPYKLKTKYRFIFFINRSLVLAYNIQHTQGSIRYKLHFRKLHVQVLVEQCQSVSNRRLLYSMDYVS